MMRTQLSTVAGASIPFPFGGKQRQVQVDLDPQALRANGLSGSDVVAAIGAQNLILPAGTQKIGALEYFIKLNASPAADRGVEQSADTRAQRHGDLSSATSRMCATAIRRRPTWCASMAGAPC